MPRQGQVNLEFLVHMNPNFTGISSPYESPENPEIRIDTTQTSAEEAAEQIIDYLSRS